MHFFYDHLDSDIKKILLSQIRNAWTHHSTSLEGNSLTLGETDFILEEGLTIQGKPLKDHNEVYGHAKAIEWIYTQLKSPAPIAKQDLFRLHQMVLTELIMDIDQPVGQWKSQSNFTTYIENNKQAWREYPAPQFIDQLMKQWIEMLNTSLNQDLNQAEAMACYADLQLTFVCIHPFFDGNGRMARLLANIPVLKSGFPPIVIPQEDQYRYKLCLSHYQKTITQLDQLSDLNDLPNNTERTQFMDLCNEYWEETIGLLNNANEMQNKRKR